tara:strand:+ start:827 stop:1261 length:435 start_codon:yes stop_codon:yes gene_type:complete
MTEPTLQKPSSVTSVNGRDDTVFIHLYHGRNHPDEELEDWGASGPTIGPVGISYTYGTITLHGKHTCTDLLQKEDLIYYSGFFYADFEIQTYVNANITTTSYDRFEINSHLARQRMEDQLLSMPNVRPSADDSGRGEGEDIPTN